MQQGKNVPYTYETVGKIDGVKVLKRTGNLNNRPNKLLTAKPIKNILVVNYNVER